MKIRDYVIFTVIALAAAIGTGAAFAAESGADKVLYVGTQNDYPPFTFLDKNDKLDGFDIAFVRELDKRLDGYTIEILPLGWDNSFVALETGRIQMVVDQVAVNPVREETYLFTKPYFTAQSSIIVKKGRTDIKTMDDLQGKTVLAFPGNSYTLIIEDYNASHGPTEQIKVQYASSGVSTAETLLGVAAGKVDAVIDDPVMSHAVIKEQGLDLDVIPSPVQSDPIGVALAKNAAGQELKALLDPIIEELLSDGTLKTLSEKWTESDYVPQR
ncbi:MAG: transporter substrate-binding domain-containing protein [Synergistaceae bacterium]|jgi:L-cystine transport system substrate-binding protein|nr:transporter substrate-binding domain-containing protein [Synergistaceae bacterium]